MKQTTQLAIPRVLEGLKGDPIRRILLAEQYTINGWRLDAYVQLASRREPLSAKEASDLGYERAFKIIHMRERAYDQMLSTVCEDCSEKTNISSQQLQVKPQDSNPWGFPVPYQASKPTPFVFGPVVEKTSTKPPVLTHPITRFDFRKLVKEVFGEDVDQVV